MNSKCRRCKGAGVDACGYVCACQTCPICGGRHENEIETLRSDLHAIIDALEVGRPQPISGHKVVHEQVIPLIRDLREFAANRIGATLQKPRNP
jgi:hypothetical protein